MLTSVAAYVALYFIPLGLHTTVLLSVAGYLLAIDLPSLATKLLGFCCKACDKSSPEVQANSGIFMWQWGLREAGFHFAMVVLTGGTAGVVNKFVLIDSASDLKVGEYVGYCVIGIFIAELVLTEVQRVYVGVGLYRNKLYPASVQRTAIFNKGKKRLRIVGYIRRALVNFGRFFE